MPVPTGSFVAHQPGVSYGELDELVGYAIRRAQLIVTEAFDESMSGVDMTTQRFSALVLIKENPGLKQTELARIMGIARSGALGIVNALVNAGLVRQKASSSDGRACELHLTASGVRKAPKICAQVQAHDAQITSALSNAEKKQLLALLEKIRSAR